MTEVQSPEVELMRKSSRDSSSPRRFMSAQKLRQPSPAAIENQKNSILRNKITSYQKIFESSNGRVSEKGVPHRLASTEYSKRQSLSKKIDQQKQGRYISRTPSLPKDFQTRKIMTLSRIGSGLNNMVMFDNLSNKTFQVPTLNEYIHSYEREKKQLSGRIADLKRLIANEAKIHAKLNLVCKKHMNNIQKHYDLLNKNEIELSRTSLLLEESTKQSNEFQHQIMRARQKFNQTRDCIAEDVEQIAALKTLISQKKKGIIKADKKLNEIKTILTKSLKVMESNVSDIRYLEDEKAMMLLSIKEMAELNKVD